MKDLIHSYFFEHAPISLWVVDFSRVKKHIEKLNSKGIDDFCAYFKDHPKEISSCINKMKIVDMSEASVALSEAASKQELKEKYSQLFCEETLDVFMWNLIDIGKGKTEYTAECAFRTLKGNKRDVLLHWSVLPGCEETLSRVTVSMIDITQRKILEERLKNSEEKYRQLFEKCPVGIGVSTLKGEVVDINEYMSKITGYTLEEFRKINLAETYVEPKERKRLLKELTASGFVRDWEIKLKHKDGRRYIASLNTDIVEFDGEQVALTCKQDITQRKALETLNEELAHYDSLTGLPNRILFLESFDAALTKARRANSKLCLMVLDIDSLKHVNDTLGHRDGDKLLEIIGNRLKSLVQGREMIARMGGDEFMLLAPGITTKEDTVAIAKRITNNFRKPILFHGYEMRITASTGIAVYPDDGKDREELIKKADMAMYQVKNEGGNNYMRYNRSMNSFKHTMGSKSNGTKDVCSEVALGPKLSFVTSRENLIGLINILNSVTEKIDPITASHQRRVSRLARTIAVELGLPDRQIDAVTISGALHDIGKLHVPIDIIKKRGSLSEMETSRIQTHPQVSHNILSEIGFPSQITESSLQHHERVDGSGYPFGLSGDDIPLESRILSVADTVEAMSSCRYHRSAYDLEVVLEEISRGKDTLFDVKVVEVCLSLFNGKGFRFE